MNSFHVNLSIFSLFYCYLFLGLRGAIAFALSLHLDFEDEKRHVIVTTTLIIVLFTLVILGGSTLPLMKVRLLIYMFLFTYMYLCYLSIMYPRDFIIYLSTIDISLPRLLYIFQFLKAEKKRKSKKEVTLFKTKEMVCMTMVTGLSFVLLLWGLPLQFIS